MITTDFFYWTNTSVGTTTLKEATVVKISCMKFDSEINFIGKTSGFCKMGN